MNSAIARCIRTNAIAPESPSFVSYLFIREAEAKLCTDHASPEENFT
ncbi:hypothetical protein [Oscillatoria acuminata]|nr:hypothetical protein [Oscillatoria acuminata]